MSKKTGGALRQLNIEAVVNKAAVQLGDDLVADSEPDHDWTARFFTEVQDVTSEDLQSLWAKVLAGEVRKAKSTSIRTLSILKNIDQGRLVFSRDFVLRVCFYLRAKEYCSMLEFRRWVEMQHKTR